MKVFPQHFRSEALLQEAVAGLLRRMPGRTGVRVLQGSQEYGKDIVFYVEGGMDERVLCACVIKNTRITGDAAKSSGARTVFHQAEQAFDTPFIEETGEKVKVGCVYIITPYEIPPPTISSIQGLLEQRADVIKFLGGARLIDLFKRYWPDFIADEANAIQQHLLRVSQNLENHDLIHGLATHYNLGRIEIDTKKIYVAQGFHKDLVCYSKGKTLVGATPRKEALSQKWSREDLQLALKNLEDFEIARNYLIEWDFCSRDDSAESLDKLLADFARALTNGWEEGAATQVGISRNKVGSLAPKVKVLLSNTYDLEDRLKLLNVELEKSLSKLENALARLKVLVRNPPKDGVEAISDPDFIAMCILDNCAQSSPEGTFKRIGKTRIKFSKYLLDKWNDHIMIVADPGYGKTSFCRWNALLDVEKFNSDDAKILPIYKPLHQLAREGLRSFDETFLDTLGRSALVGEDVRKFAQRTDTTFRLYLDGLDEVPSAARREQIVQLAKEGAIASKGKYQIVLTARNHVQASWLSWILRVSLSGLEKAEILDLTVQWLGAESPEIQQFYRQLKRVPGLANLMRIPLLATLIILVFKQTGRLPDGKVKLYETFIDLLSGGWDLSKGIARQTKLGQPIKKLVISALAGKIHQRGMREFGNREVKEVVKSTIADKAASAWELFRDELVEDGLLLKSGDTLQFPHISFQEFLAAQDLSGDPKHVSLRAALKEFLQGDDWWREVLRFYLGLSLKPKELYIWLNNEFDRYGLKDGDERAGYLLVSLAESFPDTNVPGRRR